MESGNIFGDRLFTALEKTEPQPGYLLVAAPDMTEPTFGRSIIYLMEYGPEGSTGVILNRRSDTALIDILPGWEALAAEPKALYVGGPVNQNSGLALGILGPHVDIAEYPQLRRISGRVCLIDLDSDPAELEGVVSNLRIYVGHAGWLPGQLDAELDVGDWFVTPSVLDDLATPAAVDLWAQVLKRQDAPLNLYATHPLDVRMN